MASADWRTPHALGDLAPVPEPAVLPVERDDPALGVDPRRQARVVEEHQREQPARLRLLRREGEPTGQQDRLAGQVDPARVPGRVDEVEHAQHDGEVAGLVQAASPQGPLGPADPLRHRRLRDVEGVGDLARGEAADRTQGQRHLGGGREVGVEAEEQGQACRRPPRAARRGRRRTSSRRCRAASLQWASTTRARSSSATRAGRTAVLDDARAPAARPRRASTASILPAGPGPRAPAGRERAARPRPAGVSARRHPGSVVRGPLGQVPPGRRSTRAAGRRPGRARRAVSRDLHRRASCDRTFDHVLSPPRGRRSRAAEPLGGEQRRRAGSRTTWSRPGPRARRERRRRRRIPLRLSHGRRAPPRPRAPTSPWREGGRLRAAVGDAALRAWWSPGVVGRVFVALHLVERSRGSPSRHGISTFNARERAL